MTMNEIVSVCDTAAWRPEPIIPTEGIEANVSLID